MGDSVSVTILDSSAHIQMRIQRSALTPELRRLRPLPVLQVVIAPCELKTETLSLSPAADESLACPSSYRL